MHLPAYIYLVLFQRYRPLKLWLCCEILEKKMAFGPQSCRAKGYPQISDMHFQIALSSDCVVGFGRVAFSELGD